jgi:hypothetical protein
MLGLPINKITLVGSQGETACQSIFQQEKTSQLEQIISLAYRSSPFRHLFRKEVASPPKRLGLVRRGSLSVFLA